MTTWKSIAEVRITIKVTVAIEPMPMTVPSVQPRVDRLVR